MDEGDELMYTFDEDDQDRDREDGGDGEGDGEDQMEDDEEEEEEEEEDIFQGLIDADHIRTQTHTMTHTLTQTQVHTHTRTGQTHGHARTHERMHDRTHERFLTHTGVGDRLDQGVSPYRPQRGAGDAEARRCVCETAWWLVLNSPTLLLK